MCKSLSMRERKWRMIRRASLRKYNNANACAVRRFIYMFGKRKPVRGCLRMRTSQIKGYVKM